MKKKLFIISLILITAQSFSQTVLSPVLSCNETLTAAGSPYIANTNITVNPGCSLTVNPGVEIKMGENTHLIVKGKADFLGTAAQPIHIHALDSTWGNIFLDSTLTQKSTFNHVNIENGRMSVETDQMPAVIFGYFATFDIKNCHFQNNKRCIYSFRSSNVLIKNCILDSTNQGEKILMQYGTGVVIDSCILYYTPGDADVIDFDACNNSIISNNHLYGGGDDGIDLGIPVFPGVSDSIGCNTITVQRNYIYNMFNKGVSDGERCLNININHNLIVGCDIGIGAKSGATVTADHNTLDKNRIGVKSYEHTYQTWGPGNLTVTNSIITGSIDSTWSVDSTSHLLVTYCLSDIDLIPGTGNVMGNPAFVSAIANPTGNYHLTAGSAAINKADPAFANDPDGTRSDMGVFYFDSQLGLRSNKINEDGSVFPNPGNGKFTINMTPDYKLSRVVVMNSLGQNIREEEFFNDKKEYSLDLKAQSAGIYYIRIISENNTAVKKIIIN